MPVFQQHNEERMTAFAPPLQEPDERIKATLQRQLAVQVGARVPLPCGVRGVATLLELLGDGRHADIHSVELGDAVLVIDVHVDRQPAGYER
jgi:hypothetical protein